MIVSPVCLKIERYAVADATGAVLSVGLIDSVAVEEATLRAALTGLEHRVISMPSGVLVAVIGPPRSGSVMEGGSEH